MKLGIEVIYQEFNLVPTLSVAENVFRRAMTAFVLPAVQGIAVSVHVVFFEAPEVLADRVAGQLLAGMR